MLVLDQLSKRFGDHSVVQGLSMRLAAGEIVALLGPSGCGKTTTLRMIAGFERPAAGTIHLAGTDITTLRPNRRGVGLVFQDYALFPHMTVADNVEYGLRQRRMPAGERTDRRAAMLRLVRLEGLDERRPAQLSGGQQQRVALARALAIAPPLLLLDEPLSNLDAALRETLRGELREILRAAGTTALIVTHDQQEAMGLADRIAVMYRGRILQDAPPRELYGAPATRFVAGFVGRALWFEGRVGDPAGSGLWRFRSAEGIDLVAAGPPPEGACGACVRPERVRLAARADDANHIDATVTSVGFYGSDLRYTVALAGGRALELTVPAATPDLPAAGAVVTLGIAAADVRLTAED